MTDAFNGELRKAIERYKIENKRRALDLNRRWGKSVAQQVQMDQQVLDAFRLGSITIAGTPPVTPDVWIREYTADRASTSETEWEQAVVSIMTETSKGVDMVTIQELTDMALFESSGFFNADQLRLIEIRTKEQWSAAVNDFAHVCFTANGGAFAFVTVRKDNKNIHVRIFGTPYDSSEQMQHFGIGKTVTIGRWSLIQDSVTGIGASRLRLPYAYDDIIGNNVWTDGTNGDHSSKDVAEEVFNDCLDCFKQAESEGMIQNLSIRGTCPEYSGALSEIKAPIIKLMDLELF